MFFFTGYGLGAVFFCDRPHFFVGRCVVIVCIIFFFIVLGYVVLGSKSRACYGDHYC